MAVIDFVRAKRLVPPHYVTHSYDDTTRKLIDYAIGLSRTSPVFFTDNVTEYMLSLPKSSHEWTRDDFPNVAPLFDAWWMESLTPTKEYCATHGYHDTPGVTPGERLGTLFVAADLGKDNPEYRWEVGTLTFSKHPDENHAVGPFPAGFYRVKADGGLLPGPAGGGDVRISVPGLSREEHDAFFESAKGKAVINAAVVDSKMFMLASSLAHCKNVTRSEYKPPRPERRRWEREHATPLTKGYVLNINVPRSTYTQSSAALSGCSQRALHQVKAHFMTYTEEKPMFGKYTGTFWVPQTLKGDAKIGTINKAYNVEAPLVT